MKVIVGIDEAATSGFAFVQQHRPVAWGLAKNALERRDVIARAVELAGGDPPGEDLPRAGRPARTERVSPARPARSVQRAATQLAPAEPISSAPPAVTAPCEPVSVPSTTTSTPCSANQRVRISRNSSCSDGRTLSGSS